MKNRECGVYCIKNIKNEKVYIGSAKNIEQRWGEHIRRLRRDDHENKYLQSSWNKYGEENFIFSIEIICDEFNLLVKEQEIIDLYKEKIGWRNMYNLNPNSSSGFGRKHTEESLATMREKQSGENNGFYGKKHSKKSIDKMKESHKGQKAWNKGKSWSDEIKQKIGMANKGRIVSSETRLKLSIAGKGRKLSEDQKEKLKNRPKILGRKNSEESKKKTSESMKKVSHNRDKNGKFIKKKS